MLMYHRVYTDSVGHFPHPNPDFILSTAYYSTVLLSLHQDLTTHFSLLSSLVLLASILTHLHRAYLLRSF